MRKEHISVLQYFLFVRYHLCLKNQIDLIVMTQLCLTCAEHVAQSILPYDVKEFRCYEVKIEKVGSCRELNLGHLT